MFGGALPGCGIHETADDRVALGAVEQCFVERSLRAFGVDGCRVAIHGAFAARPPAIWKPLPHRQISLEPRSRGGRCRFRGVRRGSSLRRINHSFAKEVGKLYLPTGNPLPSGRSAIALFGSPWKEDRSRRKQQCARL